MTKVTILNQYFYPDNVTSASLAYELARGLAEKEFDVKVVAGMPYEYLSGASVPKYEVKDGVEIHRIKYVYHNRSSKVGRVRNYFSFFWSIQRNKNLLKGTDILITYSSPPINPIIPAFFKKKFGYRLVYVIYDLYPDIACKFGYMKQNGVLQKMLDMINRFVYRKCDRIVVLSREMKAYFIAKKGYSDKVSVIPNWYSEDSGLLKKNYIKSEKLSILYGGNIGIVQDIKTLALGMKGLKHYDDIEFIFATHGNGQEDFFNELDKMRIKNYKRIGYLEKNKYDEFMKHVDMAIVTVDGRVSGLASPSKFYSYIAHALPVIFIGPQIMDIAKEISENDIGYTVGNGCIEQFIHAVEDFRSARQIDKIEMSQRARYLFDEKYKSGRCVDKYCILMNELEKESPA